MSKIILSLIAATSLLLPSISFAQEVAQLANGNTITIQTTAAQQVGNGPVVFVPNKTYTYRVTVKENGDREFVRADGFVNHGTDKNFTPIIWQNKSINEKWRFKRLPQDKPLQPGMTWKVPDFRVSTSCGNGSAELTAVSEVGPEVSLTIDGKISKVTTIQINYQGTVSACGASWKRTYEFLISPQLNEIVSQKQINYTAGNSIIYDGDGWLVATVQTGDTKVAEALTAK